MSVYARLRGWTLKGPNWSGTLMGVLQNYYFWILALCTGSYAAHSWFVSPLVDVGGVGVGRTSAIVVAGLTTAALIVSWLLRQREARWTTIPMLLLIGTFLFWLMHVVASFSRGQNLGLSALALPFLLLLILVKPLCYREINRAIQGWLVLLAFVVLFDIFFVGPSYGNPLGFFYERRYLSNFGIFMLDWRWAGPFGNPNFAGPVGAFAVVYSAAIRYRGWIAGLCVGLFIMLFAESRTGAVSALVGLAFVGISLLHTRLRRIVGLLLVVAVVPIGVYLYNPGLNGRVDLWTTWIAGMEWSGLSFASDSKTSHLHNVFLQLLHDAGALALLCIGLQLTLMVAALAGFSPRSWWSLLSISVSVVLAMSGDLVVVWSHLGGFMPAYLAWLGLMMSAANDLKQHKILPDSIVQSGKVGRYKLEE